MRASYQAAVRTVRCLVDSPQQSEEVGDRSLQMSDGWRARRVMSGGKGVAAAGVEGWRAVGRGVLLKLAHRRGATSSIRKSAFSVDFAEYPGFTVSGR